MPLGLYKNDGSGRDSYINECNKTDKSKKATNGASFWPDPVEEHQNRKREAVNNQPFSPSSARQLDYTRFLPTVPAKSSTEIAQYTPRRTQHCPNLDISTPRISPQASLREGLSPGELGQSSNVMLNTSGNSMGSARGGALTPRSPRGPINSLSNYYFESTAHKTQRVGRFHVATDAPPNPDVLPAIRAKAKPGVGQYA